MWQTAILARTQRLYGYYPPAHHCHRSSSDAFSPGVSLSSNLQHLQWWKDGIDVLGATGQNFLATTSGCIPSGYRFETDAQDDARTRRYGLFNPTRQ